MRYLNLENTEVSIEERILCIVLCPATDTAGEGLTTFLLKILEENDLDGLKILTIGAKNLSANS